MNTLVIEPSGYSEAALETYRKLGPVWLENAPQVADVSLLVVRLAHKLDKAFLDQYPSLQAIATPTTGLTHVDLDECQRRSIRVFSLADCRQAIDRVTSTSELTLGLIISLLRRIPMAVQDVVVNKRWVRDDFRSRQLSRLTLGIVGLGRIGGHVCSYANALGMKVVAFDPYQRADRFDELGAERFDLQSLLAASDIVSMHAALNNDNRNLLGKEQIDQMRQGALVVNTARGALIDEEALVSALRKGRLGGVAVDVLSEEHSGNSWGASPIVEAAEDGLNVIVTPHIGGCTSDAMHITEECLAEVVYGRLKAEE